MKNLLCFLLYITIWPKCSLGSRIPLLYRKKHPGAQKEQQLEWLAQCVSCFKLAWSLLGEELVTTPAQRAAMQTELGDIYLYFR